MYTREFAAILKNIWAKTANIIISCTSLGDFTCRDFLMLQGKNASSCKHHDVHQVASINTEHRTDVVFSKTAKHCAN